MTLLVFLLLVVAIAILFCVIRIAKDVRRIRAELLHDIRTALRDTCGSGRFGTPEPLGSLAHTETPLHGFVDKEHAEDRNVLWVWRGGQWVAEELPEGMDPGPPPQAPGRFEGDKVRT